MKVSELDGPQLDYWVAKAEGMEARLGVDKDGYGKLVCGTLRIPPHPDASPWWGIYRPSDNWEQGGPIIEREEINIGTVLEGWFAECGLYTGRGKTLLVAAMRCFVASTFGDEVQVPDEIPHETAISQ